MLVAISGSQGSGKAQPTYSKLLTPNGWITFADVRVGMKILTPSGKETTVVGVFPQGKKEIFEVEFEDGATVQCCADHLWQVFYKKQFHINKQLKSSEEDARRTSSKMYSGTFSLNEIKQHFFDKKRYHSNVYVPLVGKVDFINKENITIPPYVLGALLGDGDTCTPLSITNVDEDLFEEGYNLTPTANKYKDAIDELGLSGKKSHNKFIPKTYMWLSYNDRLDLLRGLMDADGTVSKTGTVSFTTVSEQLCKDVTTLVRSLGGKAKVSLRSPFYQNLEGEKIHGRQAFEIRIVHPQPKELFTLERKKQQCNTGYCDGSKDGNDTVLKNRIIGIRPINKKHEAICIKIEDEEELYITDNYIVTHNTTILKRVKEMGFSTIGRKTSRSILADWGVTLEEVNNNSELTTKFQAEITNRKYQDELNAIRSSELFFTERTHADLFTYALVSLGKDNKYSEWLNEYYKTCMEYNQSYDQVYYLRAGHFNVVHDGTRGSLQHYSRMVDLTMLDITTQMIHHSRLSIIETPDIEQRVSIITTQAKNTVWQHK